MYQVEVIMKLCKTCNKKPATTEHGRCQHCEHVALFNTRFDMCRDSGRRIGPKQGCGYPERVRMVDIPW